VPATGPELLDPFAGSQAVIESPLMKEFAEQIERQTWRKAIKRVIEVRFGTLPARARASLERLHDNGKLMELHGFAAVCPTLKAFLERQATETAPAPAPVSSRRPRKR
jgi:hypothetical protein